ncbi:MAG: alpha/beta hydrolase family protein [Vicinamibacterales bacterium]
MGRAYPGVRAAGLTVLLTAVIALPLAAGQDNRIDGITPLAPELAAFGPSPVGVRTLTAVDRQRVDVLNTPPDGPTARYDRPLALEIWYPAALATGQTPGGEYTTTTRDPAMPITLRGRAVRDAAPGAGAPRPLVVISHGYPGNRLLMSHLGENLASKGYVVVSIDHTDSTYADLKAFASTLYNRALDQRFVIDEIARLSATPGHVLAGLADASRTVVIGYSMGGYGVVNLVGGGYRREAAALSGAPPNRLLLDRAAGTPAYEASRDPRVKAAVAIGPWGMQAGYWDAAGLAGIRTPVLFVAGSADDVSGYERGTRAIFDGAVNADRYLLTFQNANHNAAAPIPAPVEAAVFSERLRSFPFVHYADPVWDTMRMNNILQHFVTAWVDLHLLGDRSKEAYLRVVPNGRDGVWAVDRDGTPLPAHTYWKGFKRGTAVGLVLEHRPPAAAQAHP